MAGRQAGPGALLQGGRPSASQGFGIRGEAAGTHAQAQAIHRVRPRREALQSDGCGPVGGGALQGPPCDSVALGVDKRLNPSRSSHTKQMLHYQPPRASPASSQSQPALQETLAG